MTSGGSVPDPAVAQLASVVPLVPAWRVDRTFDYAVPQGMPVVVGSLVRIPFGHRQVRGVVTAVSPGEIDGLEDVTGVVGPGPVAPEPLPALLEWVSGRYCAPRGRVYKACVPDRVRVTVAEPERMVSRGGAVLEGYEGAGGLLAADHGVWCVRPRPGAREQVLTDVVEIAARGAGAVLVALPEVAAVTAVGAGVFSTQPAVRLDSGADHGQRSAAWFRMAAGHGIAMGGRGALLAPAPDLRAVIVLDESHPSFKDERSPRAEAWRVALRRSQMQRALCIFVSSPPSLEMAHRVRNGDAGIVEPSREAERASRPAIELVPRPADRTVSADLHKRMGETLRSGGDVAVVVPQRGWARTLWCGHCRRSLRCTRCDAGMAVDRDGLSCPRCGLTRPRPEQCPYCRATQFRSMGAGALRIEQQLSKAFPRTRVVELEEAGLHPRPGGPPTIYVSTVAEIKEEARPPVALVGVLDADALIRRPDFRAAERAHRALSLMCSWTGPAASGGRVIIQTGDPSHHVIQAIVRSDPWYFVERELPLREELGYPPFAELVKVSATGPDSVTMIDAVAAAARAEHARVLGPIRVTDARSREQRLEVLVKCDDAMLVAAVLRGILPASPHGTRVRVDVDPR